MRSSVLVVLLLVGAILSGCAYTREKDGVKTRYFFGFGKMEYQAHLAGQPPIVIGDDFVLGVNVDRGFGVGFYHTHVEMVPGDCRVYVKAPTREQLELIVAMLRDAAKEGVCVGVGK